MVSTTADVIRKRRTARAAPPKAHPFLPRALHTQQALRVVRRTHSWIGMAGAAAGVIIGISGITLNHRATLNSQLPTEITNFQLEAPGSGFRTQTEFERFVAVSLGIGSDAQERRGPAPPAAARPGVAELGGRLVEQPRHFDAYFASATENYEIGYVDGNTYIDVVHIDRGFFSTLNRLHLASASGIVWVLIIDAFSGALVVLSVTGLLLWSRLTGPRLLAIGLAGSMLAGTVYYVGIL